MTIATSLITLLLVACYHIIILFSDIALLGKRGKHKIIVRSLILIIISSMIAFIVNSQL